VTGVTKQSIQDTFGVRMTDGPGMNSQGFSIAPGAWDSSELSKVHHVLSTLPASFRKETSELINSSSIRHGSDINGGLYSYANGDIYISDESPDFEGSIVHEMTHARQEHHSPVMSDWQSQFWNGSSPKTESISDYGNSKPSEDMAECVKAYFRRGAELKAGFPDRYNFIKTRFMEGR